jgi:hypothetical protein
MTEQDQKYLAEKMGICFHELGLCTKCKKNYLGSHVFHCLKCHEAPGYCENVDFTSEHGFFVCFNWAKKQEWWDDFPGGAEWPNALDVNLIGPRFAEELVEFLKSRG